MELTKKERETAGRKNYDAYKISVGGVSFNGQKLKEFDEMPEKIRNAWMDGAIQSNVYLTSLLNKTRTS